MRRRLGLAVLGLLGATMAAGVPGASAHTPHDDIFDVAVSPTFETDRGVLAISRRFLLRSDDGGDSWTRSVQGLDNRLQLTALGQSPHRSDLVFVASELEAVYRSTDGGWRWQRVPVGPDPDVVAFAFAPGDAETVIAADRSGSLLVSLDSGDTWQAHDTGGAITAVAMTDGDPGAVLVGREDGSLGVSDDLGVRWRRVETGLEDAVRSLAVAPDGSVVVGDAVGTVVTAGGVDDPFVAVPSRPAEARAPIMSIVPETAAGLWVVSGDGGPRVSDDGGRRWDAHVDGLTRDQMADEPGYEDREHFSHLRVSGDTMFLAGFDGLFRSVGGDRWEELQTLDTVIVGLGVTSDGGSGNRLALSTYVAGLFLSDDGGATWTSSNDGLEVPWPDRGVAPARLFNVVHSPDFAADRTMFTSHGWGVLYSVDGGDTWQQSEFVGVAPARARIDLLDPAPDFAASGEVLLGTREGEIVISDDRGETYEFVTDLGGSVRSVAYSPAVADDGVVFASVSAGTDGSGAEADSGPWRSDDRGATWRRLDGPHGRLAVSPDFATDGTVLIATRRGLHRSDDRGESWAEVDLGTDADEVVVESVAFSPDYGADGVVMVSLRGVGLLRSDDRGRSFAPFATDLIEQGFLASDFDKPTTEPIAFSPDYAADDTIYISTVTGLFRTVDDGATWDMITPAITVEPVDDESSATTVLLVAGLAILVILASGAVVVILRRR